MNEQYSNMALDSDGVPILTELVADDDPGPAASAEPVTTQTLSTTEVTARLLASELFVKQLDELALEISSGLRLQIEQTLGTAVEDAINRTLEDNKALSYDLVRGEIEGALPDMLAKALQDAGLSA